MYVYNITHIIIITILYMSYTYMCKNQNITIDLKYLIDNFMWRNVSKNCLKSY